MATWMEERYFNLCKAVLAVDDARTKAMSEEIGRRSVVCDEDIYAAIAEPLDRAIEMARVRVVNCEFHANTGTGCLSE